MSNKTAYIVAGYRTAVGKAPKGSFKIYQTRCNGCKSNRKIDGRFATVR